MTMVAADTPLFIKTLRGHTASMIISLSEEFDNLAKKVWRASEKCDLKSGQPNGANLPSFYLSCGGRLVDADNFQDLLQPYCTLTIRLRLVGGIDRQNRVGSKFGGGGVSSSQRSERERKERLKRLALESIDLAKDPYLMRNHLGTYECKLCLTLHPNEANYLAHTQGKKHQQGLARRAHLEKLKAAKEDAMQTIPERKKSTIIRKVRIGRPAYQVLKGRDPDSNQRCLSFELSFPEIGANVQPRHRFMSAFEQQIETPPDRRYQYLLIAADPYETVAFKIPNEPIDKGEDKFVTHWDVDSKKFFLTLHYDDAVEQENQEKKPGAA
jgi:splicing factor 3A subunit 2